MESAFYDDDWFARAAALIETHVDRSDKEGCWPWTGTRLPTGYGRVRLAGKAWTASRLAWVVANQGRQIPAGMMVRHHCDNPPCCRPDHLAIWTAADNGHDSASRHRSAAKARGKVGHVRERGAGRWELRVYTGKDPLTGRKKTTTKTVAAANAREANLALVDWAADIVRAPVSPDMTVLELLNRYYDMAAPYMVPAGQKETRWIIDRRLKPLHDTRLPVLGARTGASVLDAFYSALRERGGLCRARKQKCEMGTKCDHGGGSALSDASVIRAHVVLSAALSQAVKWGLLARNPAELAFAGEADSAEVVPPDPAQVKALFKLAEEEDPELVVLLVLGSTTGQRKGRLLGLWWEDLDLEAGVVTFGNVVSIGPNGPERVQIRPRKRNRKGAKTVVPLDPAIVAILLAHRARREAICRSGGVVLSPKTYVFPGNPEGTAPLNPRTVSRHFAKYRDLVGIDEGRLHDLRHFVVSYLIDAGVNMETVKDLVGHSLTSRTTDEVYRHKVSLGPQREAVGILARLLDLSSDDAPPPGRPGGNVVPIRRPAS
jgi:integrase